MAIFAVAQARKLCLHGNLTPPLFLVVGKDVLNECRNGGSGMLHTDLNGWPNPRYPNKIYFEGLIAAARIHHYNLHLET